MSPLQRLLPWLAPRAAPTPQATRSPSVKDWSWLPQFVYWAASRLCGPARPRPATITISTRTEPGMPSQYVADFAPAKFDATIDKATITPIVNGVPGTPVDTTGAMVTINVNLGDVLSNTETFTNHAGLTSDPSDKAGEVTVTDPRPGKPAPAGISIRVVDVPDAPAV